MPAALGGARSFALVVMGLVFVAPARAQELSCSQMGRICLAPFVGGLWLSDLAEVQGRLVPPGGDLGDPPERIINLTVGAQAAPSVGISAGLTVTRSLDVRLTGAFASTEFDLSGVTAGADDVESVTTFGGLSRLNVISVRADLMWKFVERPGLVSPYGVLGVGVMVYDMKDPADFFNVEPLTGVRLFPRTSRTGVAPALVVGLGTDLQLSERVGLRFEITDAYQHQSARRFRFRDKCEVRRRRRCRRRGPQLRRRMGRRRSRGKTKRRIGCLIAL